MDRTWSVGRERGPCRAALVLFCFQPRCSRLPRYSFLTGRVVGPGPREPEAKSRVRSGGAFGLRDVRGRRRATRARVDPHGECTRIRRGKKDAPIWVFAPREIIESDNEIQAKFDALNVEVVASGAPSDALAYPFGGKVYAASAAEQRTGSSAAILAWLDEDTIVLREPAEFDLDPGETFGYRPVMHQRIGSPYDEPVDAFWTRVYEVSAVPEAAIFPVTTPADGKKIRAYFNAGVLVVRPERGLLRRWESVFSTLYHDSTIVRMCGEDVYKRVFLHQAALAAAVLSTIGKDESRQFSERVNYPLFFHEQFESGENSIRSKTP